MEAPHHVFEILSERFVKPSTATPLSLRSYKLSYSDQLALPVYVPLTLFYRNPNNHIDNKKTSQILETSLSKTLSYYYPFAGRLRDNFFIECNDMGVPFIEARFRCPMTELNPQIKGLVFHKSLFVPDKSNVGLVLVQLSYFECSGIALSICMSHKLGDASTLCAFMRDWAAMVQKSNVHIPSPQLVSASLFPPLEELLVENNPSSIGSSDHELSAISKSEIPIRKFLFLEPEIAKLKDIVAKSSGVTIKNPTRVEVVSALLYRCALVSSNSTSSATFRHAMSLRTVAALPKDCVGNLVTHFSITTTKEEAIKLPELVSKLRNAKLNVQNEYKKKAKPNGSLSPEDVQILRNHQTSTKISSNKRFDSYTCTSWCGIPFYEVDFGWGKPLSLGFPNVAGSMNHFTLIDSTTAGNEGSIEAIAMLKDADHMCAFQTNQELLAFASLINA